ncbi:hypothetical protein BJV74DRAFT_799188 [Russula compacta]|nr:hypothetical protein BJV74DRAFT_799188 [Russula compacta]
MAGCDHEDYPVEQIIDLANSTQHYELNLAYVEQLPNKTQHSKCCLATGICKPTILSGLLRQLEIPQLFSIDIMHLPAINIPKLLLGLYLGPALFYGILPAQYWQNYCQLVFAIQIIYQHEIVQDELVEAH